MKKEISRVLSPDWNSIQINYDDWSFETKWKGSKELNEVNIKDKKREEILKIASLTDQINLMAWVLNTLTDKTPDKWIIQEAKDKFAKIKSILDK